MFGTLVTGVLLMSAGKGDRLLAMPGQETPAAPPSMPPRGSPHFLSETPSGPEALSPGAGETDPGAAAAAAAEGAQESGS